MKTKIVLLYLFNTTLLYSQSEQFKTLPSLADCQEVDCSNVDFGFSNDLKVPQFEIFSLDDTETLQIEKKNWIQHELNPIVSELSEFVRAYGMTKGHVQFIDEDDKKRHYEAGSLIGYFSGKACEYGFTPFQLKQSKRNRIFCAITGAALAGIAKEIYDATDTENHTVDINDALATMLGASTSFTFYKIKF
jgi:hypothetical protein